MARKTPLGIEKRFDRFGDWLDESWALRKAAPVLSRFPMAVVVLTWLMRIVVGGVFIVSGLGKGIDPWGSFYKMTEYFSAMHIPIVDWGNTVLTLAFMLFSVEFIVGVSILTGCFRKAAPIIAALFMLVMLPLTLWIAVADPVADCGCFGEFIVISNWSTFIKNCLLSVAVVWLLKFNRTASCLISPSVQWLAAVAVAAYIIAVGYVGYWQQPTVDFRPYPVGSRLFAADEKSEFEPVFSFFYEKDGEVREFSADDVLPDENEGWKFLRREEKGFVKNEDASAVPAEDTPDFRIWSEDGEEDVTGSVISDGRQLMLLIPDIKSISMAASWKINRLFDMSTADGIEFFAVAAGSPDDIENWRDLSSGQYPIYTADDTSIKELARGNPALVSLDEGVITWKSALSALRLVDDDQMSDSLSTTPVGVGMSGGQTLSALSIFLVAFLAALAFLSSLIKVLSRS